MNISGSNPQWDEWGPWGSCTLQDCGAGYYSRTRTCSDAISGEVIESGACGADDMEEAQCHGSVCPSMQFNYSNSKHFNVSIISFKLLPLDIRCLSFKANVSLHSCYSDNFWFVNGIKKENLFLFHNDELQSGAIGLIGSNVVRQ